VLLCDDCHKLLKDANVYRFSGIATVLLGVCMFFVYPNASYPPLWTICTGAALLLIGALLVIRGRRRIAALEKRVGFK
jgi:protein-S-isoprenylcysteine O-methyltransferase Ste14